MSQHADLDGPADPEASTRMRTARHDEAVIAAEVRALRRAIAPYGVLDGKTLHKMAHAESWHAGAFTAALGAAVDTGVLTRLPFGFYADAEALTSDARPSEEPDDVPPVR